MTPYWLRYRGTRFPLRRGETIVGRSAYCTIVLSNTLASRQHCALRFGADGLTIVDLGSSNGTLVNGQRITAERVLAPGDVIRIGTDLLEVVAGSTAPAQRERKITSPESPRSQEQFGGDFPTGVHESTLDLVEALANSAEQTRDPRPLSASIQRAIDAIVERALRSDERFERAAAARLCAVVETIAAWHEDSALEEWRAERLRTISERSLG